MTDGPEGQIRGIDIEPVSGWLASNVEGAHAPFEFSPIQGGHSNLTYRVVGADGTAFVLRRPPLGAVLATAHDMGREHRIISGVGLTKVPVPKALGLCEDETINGAPFYVMDFVDGPVLVDSAAAEHSVREDDRSITSESVVAILADLHAVVPDDVGLGTLGKKEDYLARQLRRWIRQWEASKTRELATMESVSEALAARMPKQIGASIVHGDYRLGNMITGSDARVAAVLDWELCTLGDPLADVGYLLNDWLEPEEAPVSAISRPGPSAAPGFWSRARLIAEYQDRTGRDLTGIDYYRAFQYWRLAAIVEGVLARYLKGVMQHEADTDGFRLRVEALADSAHHLLEL